MRDITKKAIQELREVERPVMTAAEPTRPADIQVLDGTAYVLDAETGQFLFTVNLKYPGGAQRVFLEGWRRGYETDAVRDAVNRDGRLVWRFRRKSKKDRP